MVAPEPRGLRALVGWLRHWSCASLYVIEVGWYKIITVPTRCSNSSIQQVHTTGVSTYQACIPGVYMYQACIPGVYTRRVYVPRVSIVPFGKFIPGSFTGPLGQPHERLFRRNPELARNDLLNSSSCSLSTLEVFGSPSPTAITLTSTSTLISKYSVLANHVLAVGPPTFLD